MPYRVVPMQGQTESWEPRVRSEAEYRPTWAGLREKDVRGSHPRALGEGRSGRAPGACPTGEGAAVPGEQSEQRHRAAQGIPDPLPTPAAQPVSLGVWYEHSETLKKALGISGPCKKHHCRKTHSPQDQ